MRPGLYSIESISKQAPRSFASIEGNTRGAGREMNSVNDNPNANDKTIDCQCNANELSIECQLTFNWRVILRDPVSIVQNLSQGRLLSRLPL